MKQELPSIEYIRSENHLIDHSIVVQKQNHYSRDREYENHDFPHFFMPCFPFWQPMHFYASGSDQWHNYQLPASNFSPIHIKQETANNDPALASQALESILQSDHCLAVIKASPIRPESGTQQVHRCEKRRRRFNSFFWTLQENRRYLKFIKKNSNIFQLPTYQKKSLKVNVLMSFKVKSRNAQQCHSHHQKLVKKYGSIEGVLANLEKDLAAQRQGYRKRPEKEGSRQISQIKTEKSTIKRQP